MTARWIGSSNQFHFQALTFLCTYRHFHYSNGKKIDILIAKYDEESNSQMDLQAARIEMFSDQLSSVLSRSKDRANSEDIDVEDDMDSFLENLGLDYF